MLSRILSLPNLVLGLLSFFVLFFVFLQTEESLPVLSIPIELNSQSIKITQLNQVSSFGYNYTVESNSKQYSLFVNDRLDIGSSYRIDGELKEYSKLDLNTSEQASFIRYELSRGLSGRISKVKIKTQEMSCDLVCNLHKQSHTVKNNITKTYDHYYCKFFYDYTKILGVESVKI